MRICYTAQIQENVGGGPDPYKPQTTGFGRLWYTMHKPQLLRRTETALEKYENSENPTISSQEALRPDRSKSKLRNQLTLSNIFRS